MSMRFIIRLLVVAVFLSSFSSSLLSASQPKVLVINAHPDDESGCAATIYKITHDLHGTVDLCLITNGEAGFKYSTLAEDWYGLELTDEAVGRANLPRIRKQEMMSAGKVVGLRNIIFLEHQDQRYTTDVDEVFRQAWDTTQVARQLGDILKRGKYDFVFCLLPTPDTHGGHKGASILALEQIAAMQQPRPIVLGVGFAKRDSLDKPVKTLEAYPVTQLRGGMSPFIFDKATPFGFNKRLNYKIIVNWLVAEHKSQGTVQLGLNEMELEAFYYFALNGEAGIEKTRALFDELKVVHYPEKKY